MTRPHEGNRQRVVPPHVGARYSFHEPDGLTGFRDFDLRDGNLGQIGNKLLRRKELRRSEARKEGFSLRLPRVIPSFA